MNTYSLVLTIVITLAVVAAILLFERKRARQIEHDLGQQSQEEQKRRRRQGRG